MSIKQVLTLMVTAQLNLDEADVKLSKAIAETEEASNELKLLLQRNCVSLGDRFELNGDTYQIITGIDRQVTVRKESKLISL